MRDVREVAHSDPGAAALRSPSSPSPGGRIVSRPYYDEHGIHREPSDTEMLAIIRKALHPDKSNQAQIDRETIPSHVKQSGRKEGAES